MSQPINLNRARKSRARDEKRKIADQNAVRFGRSKSQRVLEAVRSEKARRMLDQHHLDEE
ncbi:MAG: DUF4169 domain-containing protein [Rhodobacterales bacterium]|nr:MAG: DUF4169 domain-containing protein [Rhodobacterales bacterium]